MVSLRVSTPYVKFSILFYYILCICNSFCFYWCITIKTNKQINIQNLLNLWPSMKSIQSPWLFRPGKWSTGDLGKQKGSLLWFQWIIINQQSNYYREKALHVLTHVNTAVKMVILTGNLTNTYRKDQSTQNIIVPVRH